MGLIQKKHLRVFLKFNKQLLYMLQRQIFCSKLKLLIVFWEEKEWDAPTDFQSVSCWK